MSESAGLATRGHEPGVRPSYVHGDMGEYKDVTKTSGKDQRAVITGLMMQECAIWVGDNRAGVGAAAGHVKTLGLLLRMARAKRRRWKGGEARRPGGVTWLP